MKFKLIKFALLVGVGAFFINACLSAKPAPIKRESTTPSPQSAAVQQMPVLVDFSDELKFKQLQSNFAKPNLHLRIFGDSHMAADFFSSRLRTHIATNAVGFAYPLQPKYHQVVPLQYTSKYFEILNSKSNADGSGAKDFPMGGVIAKSAKAGAFINLDSIKEDEFSFGILFQSPHTNDALIITDAKGKIFRLKSPKKDKWTHATLVNLHFPLSINAVDKGILLGGFFITSDKEGAILDTLGINGAKSDLWLRWDKDLFLQELNLLKSDIVVLAYGSNDALIGEFDETHFKESYKKLIALLYASNPNTSIILISPPTITYKVNETFELHPDFYRVQKAIYELAKEEKLVLFDMHKLIENYGGKGLWIEQNLSRNDVHLTPDGYKLMADEFYSAIQQMLKKPTYSLAN